MPALALAQPQASSVDKAAMNTAVDPCIDVISSLNLTREKILARMPSNVRKLRHVLATITDEFRAYMRAGTAVGHTNGAQVASASLALGVGAASIALFVALAQLGLRLLAKVDLGAGMRAGNPAAGIAAAGAYVGFGEVIAAGQSNRRHDAVWIADARFERAACYGLDAEAHLRRCRELAADGYRPVRMESGIALE